MNDRTANIVMTAVLFTYMILQPPFGAFSDRFGRKTSMLLFSGLATVCTVPLMYAIGDVKSPYAAYGLIILALAIVSFYTSISGLGESGNVSARSTRDERRPCLRDRQCDLRRVRRIRRAVGSRIAEPESNFYWYVTFMCAIAFVASIVMPNPKLKGYLQGQGTET